MNLVIIDSNNLVSVDRCQYEDHMQTNINVLGKIKLADCEDSANVDNPMCVKNIIVFKDDDSLVSFYMQLKDYVQSNKLI